MGLRLIQRFSIALAVLGVSTLVTHARAQSPRDADPSRIASEQVATLSRQLADSTLDPEIRSAAARRLISIGNSEARNAVLFTLKDPSPSNVEGRLAAVRAVADDLPADPRFVDALFVLFDAGQRRDILDGAVVALGNYKTNADVNSRLILLTSVANDTTVRIAAIRTLGRHVEKAGAKRLVELTEDPVPQVAFSSSDALQMLSSIQFTTAADWANWWKGQADRAPEKFRDEMLSARVSMLEQESRQRDDAYQDLRRSVETAISGASNEQLGDVLNRLLTSPRESVRILAVGQAYQLATTGDLPTTSRSVIRSMLSDPRREIRFQAARTISRVNDVDAFDPISRQIAIESDPGVSAELTNALGVIGNVDAVPILRRHLDNPSASVVQASALALAKLGPALAERDPASAEELSNRIRALLIALPKTPGNARQREALIAAIVPLKQPAMGSMFKQMLTSDPRESESIRRLAAAGLGAIGDPDMADLLVEVMNDTLASTPTVRLEAVNALGHVANSFSLQANALYTRMDPKFEPNSEIRSAAWTVITRLFGTATREQLAGWPDKSLVKGDASKELLIFQSLAEKAQVAKDQEEYIQRLEQVGDSQMTLAEAAVSPDREDHFANATANFKKALDLTRANAGSSGQTERLIESTLKSMLRARRYADAAKFTSDLLSDPANQQYQVVVGPQFRIEAERLADNAGQLDDALSLIRAALAIEPSLASNYTSLLRDIQSRIETRKQEKNQLAVPEVLQALARR